MKLLLVVLTTSLLLAFSAKAELLEFHVVNQDGEVLENSVLEQVVAEPELSSSGEIAIVDQIDKAFVPEHRVIQVGQQVDFPNSDNIRHHVYSFSKAKTFELKLYADRPEAPIPFNQHGVVVLGCNIHDAMVGYIYVAASPKAELTNELGRASLSLNKHDQILVWHAYQTAALEKPQRFDINKLERENGVYKLVIPTEPPPERDTFEANFR